MNARRILGLFDEHTIEDRFAGLGAIAFQVKGLRTGERSITGICIAGGSDEDTIAYYDR